MERLVLMPLVSDFGELFDERIGVLNPEIRLVLTRDERISQYFRGDTEFVSKYSFVLPPGMKLAFMSEEDPAEYSRVDLGGEPILWCVANRIAQVPVPEDTSPINKGILSLFKQLPMDNPVLFMWK